MSLAMVVDLIFIFVTAILAVRGLLRGFLGEIISLLATVGGVILSLRFADQGGRAILGFLPEISDTVARAVAMVTIFVVVALLGAILGKLSKAFLSLASLTFLDRMLGVLAGVVKSVAILMVVFVLLSLSGPLVPKELKTESRAMALASSIWPYVAPYVISSGLLPEPGSGTVL